MNIEAVISLFFVWIICFIPIVFWGYFFSFVDSSVFNKKRFFLGILAGSMSTLPILALDRVFEVQSFSALHIFENSATLWGIASYGVNFFSFLFILLLVIWTITLFSFVMTQLKRKDFSIFFKSFMWFLVTIICILFIFFLVQILGGIFPSIEAGSLTNAPAFTTTVFNSLKLVIFYYVIISFLEESAKHFSFLGSGIPENINLKQAVLFSIFVALGFSFLENILYWLKIIEEHGLWMELFAIVFYRSVFSLFIHVFSSALLWYFFAKAYIKYKEGIVNWWFIKELLFWIILALLFHSSFDIFISYNMSIFIFVYFIIWYFWVSKLVFYK